jgi:hypothetical protein
LIKASLRKGTDKIDAEGGRIIKMYYYANKELYIIIINNGGKVICLPNFVWETMETKKGGYRKILDSFHQTS